MRDKIFSLLTILGLTVGMSSFLLILIYMFNQLNYESFHENRERIYRVTLKQYHNNDLFHNSAENYPGVGPALKEEFPEVLNYTRVYNAGVKNNVVISCERNNGERRSLKSNKVLYADSSFLKIFSFPLSKGNFSTALDGAFKAVISEEYARKMFGEMDPMGKLIVMNDDDFNNESFVIEGVLKKVPENTHLHFDILLSYATLLRRGPKASERYNYSWDRKDMYTYILLNEGVKAESLTVNFESLVDNYNPGLKELNRKDVLSLQKLSQIHVSPNLSDESGINVDENSIYFILTIAVLILAIAWINYTNLSTVKSLERAKEVGVRKVAGAEPSHLIRQFLFESTVLNIVAVVISLLIVIVFVRFFGERIDIVNIPLDYFWFWITPFIILTVGILSSGLYPAFILSNLQPVVATKGKYTNSKGGGILKKALVIFQLTTTITLAGCTFVIYEQLSFARKANLGFDLSGIVVLPRPISLNRETAKEQAELLKTELQRDPRIKSVAGASIMPGNKIRGKELVHRPGQNAASEVYFNFGSIDYEFVESLNLGLLAGRNFSLSYPSDRDTAVIVTESVVKELGFNNSQDAIGKTIVIDRFNWEPIIIGVVNDYYHESVRAKKMPTLFFLERTTSEYYYVKINQLDPSIISDVEKKWKKHFPESPFEYFFLEDHFNNQYKSDEKLGLFFSLFAIIAVVISSLGLLGLSMYTIKQKLKEIGIRKVLGAIEYQIIMLLLRDFLLLLFYSSLFAFPLIYFLMMKWLEDFSSKIDLHVMHFVLPVLSVLLITFLAIGYQLIKASRLQPVSILKHE